MERDEFAEPAGDRPPATTRSTMRRLLGDTLVYGLGRVAGYLAAIVLMPVYTHYLSVAEYGVLENLVIFVSLVSTLLSLGLPNALQRFWFLAKDADERARTVGSAVSGCLVLLLLWLPPLFLFARSMVAGWFGREHALVAYRFAVVTLVPGCFLSLLLALLRARFKSWEFAACSITQVVLLAAVNTWLIIGRGMGVDGVFLGGAIAGGGAVLLGAWFVRRDLSLRLSLPMLRSMLHYGAPLVPAALAFWALSYADRYLLTRLAGLEETGLYAAGARVAGVLFFVNFATSSAFGPLAFEIAGEPTARRVYARSLTGYACIAAVMGVALTALAREVLVVMTPPEYHEGYRVVPWLILGFLLVGTSPFLTIGLHLERRTSRIMWIALGAAGLNVLLNLLLIPRWGMTGAAAATAAAYGAMAVANHLASRSVHPIDFEWGKLARLLALTLAAFAGVGLLDGGGTAHILARVAIASLFPLLIPLAGVLRPEDLRNLIGALRKR